jgi:WD40 repeat protein
LVADLAGKGTDAFFSPDGKLMACMQPDRWVCVLSVPGFREEVDRIPDPNTGSKAVFSPDSRLLVWASLGRPDILHVRDIARRHNFLRLTMPSNTPYDIAFSPGGTLLAAADWAGPVAVWDLTTGKKIAQLVGHTQGAGAIAFSHDGRTLATDGLDGNIKLWNVATWREIGQVRTGIAGIGSLRFLPKDRGLVVADGTGIRVLRAPSFAEIAAREAASQ